MKTKQVLLKYLRSSLLSQTHVATTYGCHIAVVGYSFHPTHSGQFSSYTDSLRFSEKSVRIHELL